jgi:hypothetical protein
VPRRRNELSSSTFLSANETRKIVFVVYGRYSSRLDKQKDSLAQSRAGEETSFTDLSDTTDVSLKRLDAAHVLVFGLHRG